MARRGPRVLRGYSADTMDANGSSPADNLTWDWAAPTESVFLNGTNTTAPANSSSVCVVKFCAQWESAQHNLFQIANMFFAAAFLVPKSFTQSLLLLRALLSSGFLLSAIWAGSHVCAPDVLCWSLALAVLNGAHTAILTARYLPPPLSLELTELYTRLFEPLRVSKKHFKELVRDASMVVLAPGDSYALEEVTPADERLAILLTGKLKVSCEGTHLHYIYSHQFVDSPEWESSHESSEDMFQVTITAEEESQCLVWSRIKLQRALRHRASLKAVLYNIIGKDITQKLYSLNEHQALNSAELHVRSTGTSGPENWRGLMTRSLSVDAVHTGTRGHVRSLIWRTQTGRRSSAQSDRSSPSRKSKQCWIPLVANHFPSSSPFTNYQSYLEASGGGNQVLSLSQAAAVAKVETVDVEPILAIPLLPAGPVILPVAAAPAVPGIMPVIAPPPMPFVRTRSFRRPREVKFDTPV